MKKIIALLLILVLSVSLVACLDKDTDSDATITRGETVGTKYENDVFGFTFTAPATWVYSTDDEVAALVGMSVEALGDSRFQAALDKNTAIYDMMVRDVVTNSNVLVGYENLKKTLATNITEEQYVEAMKSQMSSVTGMTVKFPDATEQVKLGNTTFTKVVCQTTTYGVTMTQVYYIRKVGNYMGFVIVTINDGYSIQDIEAMFK